MVDTTDAVLAFLAAVLISWAAVPPAERLARRVGAIDEPGPRSQHQVATPAMSGVAILAAIEIAGWIWLPSDDQTTAILLGAVAIALVGALDDVFELPALVKLGGQIVAAAIPVSAGVHPDALTIPFIGGFELGWTAWPLTIFGIVAVTNIVNLIDGIDGLAAGVVAIAAAAMAVIALSLDRFEAGVLAAITSGAALGYLRHGFPPASSFMGDTGSNLLGFMIAVVSIQGALKTNAVVALAFPLVILALPIFDTAFVVAKRIKYHQPIYQADRWHFHHRMANIGFSQRRTLAYLYGWTLVLALLALALRLVPYSDDRGNFDLLWTAVMAVVILAAIAVTVYLAYVLEIIKGPRPKDVPQAAPGEAAGDRPDEAPGDAR
ncbi:MAG: undecaprenyl/decaprenyl-phosphate alpha-N-acetylglucosaminyl 1-phosphate transferase [Solirubrobacterales bacterium]|nr:undecaprenyl/decaprenyl-phosphate alpha-N-acetylglucosaminyl 1-phosphate transferase [Solirubrobacterales bacterium]